MDLKLSDVAAATGGRLDGPDLQVSGATIDSRSITPGQLFVPVVAERDGHDFVGAALAAGAAGYLTSRELVGGSAVVVDDTAVALAHLGRHARDHLGADAHVVGVTGSVGKTSVKDLLAAALAARWRTSASVKSFNNELGVPLTLFNAPEGTEALVVEMGARDRGHVKALCDLALPTVGVVTRVAAVHTEVFGTIDDVAAAKAELVEALPAHGTAVLNAADPRVAAMAARTRARALTFGAGGDVHADHVTVDDDLRARFTLRSPWGSADVQLNVRGVHMVENALAAGAAALACDVPVEALPEALAAAELSPWRMEVVRLTSGAVLVNDAYNANPTSMAAALQALAALPATRRVAVLGVMAEIGATSDAEHVGIGELARDLGIEVVSVGVPAYGGVLVDGDDLDAAVAALGPLGEGVAVLVKASRVAELERLAARLT
ncbi:MAG TPA: UDP-N-acetylmuramoyl-tripeptide--D-alanyl-D-alanine ligase [Acidimicrobiales bacterium]|nr:UDP-N-acetylmuramoyl-tripeptide--D-alanyl-D-alanine ligase [Acidimicrobiales bacterium]